MDYLNKKLKLVNIKKLFLLRNLIFSFLKVFLKKGKLNKYIFLLYAILEGLLSFCKNLVFFFYVIYKRLLLPIYFKTRVVAGKKILIPFRLLKEKNLCFMWRLISDNCKKRQEYSLKNKIVLELIDIFKNKGLTIKRRLQYCKEIKNNSPNTRFLR